MVSGEVVGAIGMTEPGAGSDLQAMRTNAILKGDHYLLNGSKTFISNGQHADLVVLAVKTDPQARAKGVSLMLVDTHLEGFKKARTWTKLVCIHRILQSCSSIMSKYRKINCWVSQVRASSI